MARFDVYPMPDGPGYLLDVQSDLLEGMTTRVVVPLLPLPSAPPLATRLNPVFRVEGEEVGMITQSLAAVPVSILGRPVGSLDGAADDVRNALDMVFVGF